MELYIGGISQGKLNYVLTKYKGEIDKGEVCDGAVCTKEEILTKPIINHFHEFIRRLLREQADIEGFLDTLIKTNLEVSIISNEVGYGIVPMDKEDRNYREVVGRSLCKLATKAVRVERIVCGLGMQIK